MKSKCELCEFWKPDEYDIDQGQCHHNAPAYTSGKGAMSWPTTQATEWCGDFRYHQHQEDPIKKCKFCATWQPHGDFATDGECRHSAPNAVHKSDHRAWITTQSDQWCGQYEKRAGKLVGTDPCPV